MKLLIISLIFLSSCSTIKRSMTAGALAGGALGTSGGATFSPTDENKDKK